MFEQDSKHEFILGSGSPRRKELLLGLGLTFKVAVPDVDETPASGESADAMVGRLALAKALAVSARTPGCWVLAADTTVVCAGRILGKPESVAEAHEMLGFIQGREHSVVGGVCIWDPRAGESECAVLSTTVKIRALTTAEIEAYVASGEPLDKAGSYAIQGLGAQLVERIAGSYTNVVGLDIGWVVETGLRRGLLKTAGAGSGA